MEDNKDFELLDVKQERDVEPELLEDVEEVFLFEFIGF